MDKIVKQQMILESFDILKDSWESKKGAILRLICKMFMIDAKTAMDMWLYILQNNQQIFSDPNKDYLSYSLTEEIVKGIIYGPNCGCYFTDFDNENEKKLAELVFAKKDICDFLFYKSNSLDDTTIYLMSHLIVSEDSSKLFEVLKLILKSRSKESIGKVLTTAIEHIYNVEVPRSQIELLENFVANISDKKERAEAFTALLSLDN